MDETELQEEINHIVGIDPAALGKDQWAISSVTVDSSGLLNVSDNVLSIPAVDELKEQLDKLSFHTSKNPPEDILRDVSVADIATHYIIDRISREEVVERISKIWPEANGLDFSAFMDKLDRDKEDYWKKVRGEKQLGA